MSDEQGSKDAGFLALASAIKSSPSSSARMRVLADHLILEHRTADDVPSEHETTAMTFARQMDGVIDAANRSHGFETRAARRVDMARRLGFFGLVVVDAAILAGLIECKMELVEAAALRRAIGRAEAELAPIAAEQAAAGGCSTYEIPTDPAELRMLEALVDHAMPTAFHRGDYSNPNVND